MKNPYPWPEHMMICRAFAPEVYDIEGQISILRDELAEALTPFLSGGRWTHVVPYMLLCTLDAYDQEASVAACLGFLKHLKEADKTDGIKRESLKLLQLPKEPV